MNAIAKKLLIKPGQKWLFIHAPENILATLEPLPQGVQTGFTTDSIADGLLLFAKDSIALQSGLQEIQPALKPDTILWVAYPKKSSGIKSDLAMTGDWSIARNFGLEPCASAAINETWTGLRFRPQGQSKRTDISNGQIKTNEYSNYIDVANKQVTLPPDVEAALLPHPLAFENYKSLSYSNKKEYVLWILTAKQEKTKSERLAKMVEKLAAGKKNPSEK